MTAYLTFVHALSSLHAGTGQGSGIIDLPIAREKATGLPYLPGSSLKGALRANCEKLITIGNGKEVKGERIFGSEEIGVASNTAGTIQISDQRLLLLPVRSLAGTFAWVTSPYVLHRFTRDMTELSFSKITAPDLKDTHQACIVTSGTDTCQLLANKEKDKIYLEDLDLQPQKDSDMRDWANWLGQQIFPGEDGSAWRRMLCERFCVVHDDVFNFLLKTATEVIARIRLAEDSKTVQKGGLWYEEALPAETVLSGLALMTPRPKSPNGARNGNEQEELSAEEIGKVFEKIAQKHIQLGGKSTVGRGQCQMHVVADRSVK
jgi:CRISPR-associated protein Cmr4